MNIRSLYLALLVLLMTLPSLVFADDFSDAQRSFNAYRSRVTTLQNQAQHKYLIAEFASLTQWMNNAERYLREEEEDEFVRTVQLVKVQLRLIEVSIEEINAREQLLSLTEDMNRLEGKAKQEREAIVEIERQMSGTINTINTRNIPQAPNSPSYVAPPPTPVVPNPSGVYPTAPSQTHGGGF